MIREDEWLGIVFGYPVFRLDIDQDNSTLLECATLLATHAAHQAHAMYYAKVGTTEGEVVRQLSRVGMYVVDVNVVFRLDRPFDSTAQVPTRVEVTPVRPDHHDDILRMAAGCFRYSRFHIDPLIPLETANRVKRDWVANYIRGQRGEALLVAMLDRKPVGFLAILASRSDDRLVRTIDLIGVDQVCQRQGIGEALIQHFIQHYGDGAAYLQVGTQAANIPSLRLYEKMGFRVEATTYVMHKHVGG